MITVSVSPLCYTLTHCGFTLPASSSSNVVLIAGRPRELADNPMREQAQLGHLLRLVLDVHEVVSMY